MTRQYGCRCAFQAGTVHFMQARPRAERPPLDLGKDLERAVERNEFGLEYQPIIDLQSGAIAAVEALLRWRHPLLGTLPPADYLPLAEESGLIVPIGQRVLETALKQLRTWHLGFARMQGLGMNVNVSARQLARIDFAAYVDQTLEAAEISPVALTLELGPGCADHLDSAFALRDLGVNLAIEDFGQGSTLEDVRRLPVSALKLHSSFVSLAGGPPEDVAFAESLLAIARARNLTTTGKGVETRDQARRLAALGCDLAQGYLYSKPLGPEGNGTLLARGRVSFPGVVRLVR
jgi:EAL domain-containing protein (putative c-di-GMP-specific phosphodiesterase class I)